MDGEKIRLFRHAGSVWFYDGNLGESEMALLVNPFDTSESAFVPEANCRELHGDKYAETLQAIVKFKMEQPKSEPVVYELVVNKKKVAELKIENGPHSSNNWLYKLFRDFKPID